MTVMAMFTVKGHNLVGKYDALMKKLPSVSSDKPRAHICCPKDDGLLIIDLWDSPEALQRFAENPAFAALRKEVGLPDPEVVVLPVHQSAW